MNQQELAVELAKHDEVKYVEGAWPEGPWSGYGWVCDCGELMPVGEGRIPAGVPDGVWWRAWHRAGITLSVPA